MTEQARHPVGSVAEETARLLEALFADGAGPESDDREPGAGRDDAGASLPPEPGPAPAAEDMDEAAGQPCEACGQLRGRQPSSSCQVCPVCQLVSAVRSVSPETVDRLADLAAAVTESLRELARSRWSQTGGRAAARRGSTVEDIAVGDEEPDEPESQPPRPDGHPGGSATRSRRRGETGV